MTYENLRWEFTPGNFTKVVALILILELKTDNKKSQIDTPWLAT